MALLCCKAEHRQLCFIHTHGSISASVSSVFHSLNMWKSCLAWQSNVCMGNGATWEQAEVAQLPCRGGENSLPRKSPGCSGSRNVSILSPFFVRLAELYRASTVYGQSSTGGSGIKGIKEIKPNTSDRASHGNFSGQCLCKKHGSLLFLMKGDLRRSEQSQVSIYKSTMTQYLIFSSP